MLVDQKSTGLSKLEVYDEVSHELEPRRYLESNVIVSIKQFNESCSRYSQTLFPF